MTDSALLALLDGTCPVALKEEPSSERRITEPKFLGHWCPLSSPPTSLDTDGPFFSPTAPAQIQKVLVQVFGMSLR